MALVAFTLAGCSDDVLPFQEPGEGSFDPSSTGDAPADSSPQPSTETSIDPGSSSGSDEITGGSEGSGSETGAPIDEDWEAFLTEREDFLEQLAVPIVDCIDNDDTDHPVFDGCIDWHSAVHATYALHVVYDATDNPAYLGAAQAKLTSDGLADELFDVQSEALFELPYGYSWFLLLAIERERVTGSTELRPLADEIADQLSLWIAGLTPGGIEALVQEHAYNNLSWAVLNLWRWAVFTENTTLATQMETFTEDHLLDPALDAACPLAIEGSDLGAFFPPCLHRLMAITAILPADVVDPWLASYLPEHYELTPLGPDEIVNSPHLAGLNFARAWGLWHAYVATGDTRWRTLYVDHVRAHVGMPQFWAEDYGNYAHWVAQFGVHAIALSGDPQR